MPRRNQSKRPRRHVPPHMKGSGKKRPRGYHRGGQNGGGSDDVLYLDIERRLRDAEEDEAAA